MKPAIMIVVDRIATRCGVIDIWLANHHHSRLWRLWHFGPYKFWMIHVRDPAKHWARGNRFE